MQQQRMQDNNDTEPIHQLWLIYCKLKDAETDPTAREHLARAQLAE
jgi:hypothetical protein